jgi:hypothetical protein
MTRAMSLQAAGLALIVCAGLVHGKLTNRWETPDLEGPAARLAELPWVIGDWKGGDKPVELGPAVVQLDYSESLGEVRTYVNRVTRAALTVHLTCGLRTPTLIHSPDLCYPQAGYECIRDKERRTITPAGPLNPAEFWVATYSKATAEVPHDLRLFWTWRGGKEWRAPESPRFVFAPFPRIFKLVVLQELSPVAETQGTDPAPQFLELLLPEVEKVVGP